MKLEMLFKQYPRLRQYSSNWRVLRRGAVVLLVVVFVAGGLIYWGRQEELTKAEWPGWVQAVGSIAAIAGAWMLGRDQSKQAFQQALQLGNHERVERVRALFPIAAHAFELVAELANEPYDDYYKLKYSAVAFQTCQRALEAIPLHELGNFGLVQGYMEMQQALQAAAHAAAMRVEIGQMEFGRRKRARASDDHIQAALARATGALQQIKDSQPKRLGANSLW